MAEQVVSAVTLENRRFWDELCGSETARALGINDDSRASIEKFDDYYCKTYPYLDRYIPFADLCGKRVLEIGLGYGTIAERIVQAGAEYVGLDVAQGPVAMVRQRIQHIGGMGTALVGSILDAPFEASKFDTVISIGCLHHTGDLEKALDEVHRVLRPGGTALIMVYYAFSYRRWLRRPLETARQLARERGGVAVSENGSVAERGWYDSSTTGAAAPATVFTSETALRALAQKKWSGIRVRRENAAREMVFRVVSRPILLKTIGRWAGLDLYCELTK